MALQAMHTISFRRLTLVAAIASSFVLPVPAAEQTDIGSALSRAAVAAAVAIV